MRFRTIPLLGLVSLLLTATPAAAMKYQINDVRIWLSVKGYTNVGSTYTIDQFSITSGQDPDQHIYQGLSRGYFGNRGSMTFSVGQSSSSAVADWWKQMVGRSQTTAWVDLDELNFAFVGTLRITLTGGVLGNRQDTYTLTDIALSQGRTGTGRPWLFGGKHCTASKALTVLCKGMNAAGEEADFYFHQRDNNVIDLNKITLPSQ